MTPHHEVCSVPVADSSCHNCRQGNRPIEVNGAISQTYVPRLVVDRKIVTAPIIILDTDYIQNDTTVASKNTKDSAARLLAMSLDGELV